MAYTSRYSGPDPEDVYYDEDMGLYCDSDSGEYYYDEECTDPALQGDD